MSRSYLPLDPDRELVFGYDPPMRTYFVQLWDRAFDADFEHGAPAKAAGYHWSEKVSPLAGEYGPYPLGMAKLNKVLEEWGVTDEQRDAVGRRLAQMNAPLL